VAGVEVSFCDLTHSFSF